MSLRLKNNQEIKMNKINKEIILEFEGDFLILDPEIEYIQTTYEEDADGNRGTDCIELGKIRRVGQGRASRYIKI